jgi:DNA-binding MarR family transcriptional regulator
MSRETSPAAALPAGAPARTRELLLAELGDAVRANQRATDQIDDAAAALMGVNRTDGRLLDLLEQVGQLSAGELAREAGLTSGAVTTAIDRLERGGLVRRIADPADRRRVIVELTERAGQLAWEMFGPMATAAEELLAGYSDADLELLIEFNRLGREIQLRRAAELRELKRARDGDARAR